MKERREGISEIKRRESDDWINGWTNRTNFFFRQMIQSGVSAGVLAEVERPD